MPRVRNAFKIQSADAPVVDTSQFLQLYCPLLLNQFERDDLFIPKLIIVSGSPGSGKSSILRLFDTETLLAIHERPAFHRETDLVERLTELGVLDEAGPTIVGISIHCDSTVRDIWDVGDDSQSNNLFNTLLDVRIVSSFLKGLRRLESAHVLTSLENVQLHPLPSEDAPPQLFSESCSFSELEERCLKLESAFGALLNQFPDQSMPEGIQQHSRLFALNYLSLQMRLVQEFTRLTPVVMLDDVQDLYPAQRHHLELELLRRSPVPRWLAIRTQVSGLERLLDLEGVEEGRDYKDVALDAIFKDRPGVFEKFAKNVIQRRLQATEYLEDFTWSDFSDLLQSTEDIVPAASASKALDAMADQVTDVHVGRSIIGELKVAQASVKRTGLSLDHLQDLSRKLIVIHRAEGKGQLSMFPDDQPEAGDSKTTEAAKLFATELTGWPYYFGLDTLIDAASGNTRQLLALSAGLVDRLVYKAETNRELLVSPKDQDILLRKNSEEYYDSLEMKFRKGAAIRVFIDNIGRSFREITYRANAPIAPGVNGFGLTLKELEDALSHSDTVSSDLFRDVVTKAVAGNVLSVRRTKQGQAGSEKIVFYLNRLLCMKYRLPLGYGGFQRISVRNLMSMLHEHIGARELSRRNDLVHQGSWLSTIDAADA